MILEPNCSKRRCRHYIGIAQPDGTEKSERPVCEAYPEMIPNDIAYGHDKHLKVRPDQKNDIVYEKEL